MSNESHDPNDFRIYVNGGQQLALVGSEYACFKHGNVGQDIIFLGFGEETGPPFCGQCLRDLLDHYCVERAEEMR